MTRNEIVEFARSYKGVPYRHQGRSVRGVDCTGIVVLLGEKLGFYRESKKDLRYSRNPENFVLLEKMNEYLIPIDFYDLKIGDVLLLRITLVPQHVAIVTPYNEYSFGMVHSYDSIGRVVEHRLNRAWIDKVVQAYRIPGVKE